MNGSALVAPLAAGPLDPASHPDPPPPNETMAQFPDPADVTPHVVDLAWRLNALGERGDGTTGQLVDQLAAPVPEPDGPTRNAVSVCLSCLHSAEIPPVMLMACPVIFAAAEEARKTASPASSSLLTTPSAAIFSALAKSRPAKGSAITVS